MTFFTLLTPADTLGLKKVFLGVVLLVSVPHAFNAVLNGGSNNARLIILGAIFPLIMCFCSGLKTHSFIISFPFLYPFLYILLVFAIVNYNIPIERMMLLIGDLMALVIVVSAVIDNIGILDIYANPLLVWLNTNEEAMISKSENAMFTYVIFLKASPILFYNLVQYIKKECKLHAAFIFTALLFSGTRANIFLGSGLLIYSMLVHPKKSLKILVIALTIGIFMIFGAVLVEKVNTIFNVKKGGDLVRSISRTSIFDAINSHKMNWVIGSGFGSEYYNLARNDYVNTSELSYLEFLREGGLFFSLVMLVFLIYPIIKVWKFDKFSTAFYCAYLIAGITEPFIFTSTGMFVLMVMYSKFVKNDALEGKHVKLKAKA